MSHIELGVAAGIIKSASDLRQYYYHGLVNTARFITFGSFTLESRAGNPEPNYWFDGKETSINAIGLRNQGLQRFLDEDLLVLSTILPSDCLLRVSLAPLKHGDLGAMLKMIATHSHGHLIQEIEINAACPNHRSAEGRLHSVLAKDPDAVEYLLYETGEFGNKAILSLKIAPDTEQNNLSLIITSCCEFSIPRIVSANTRLSSSTIEGERRLSVDQGGIAGKPLLEAGLTQVRTLKWLAQSHFPTLQIDACGGITNAPALAAYSEAGADRAQVATWPYQFGTEGIRGILLG